MMRNLLILLAVAAAQAGFYFWRLRPSQFEWDSLAGIALMTLTVVFWSAVLQIAWRDRDEPADSPPEAPGAPFPWKRTAIACFFVLLAIPATLSTWIWAQTNAGQEVAQFYRKAKLPAPTFDPYSYGSANPVTYASLASCIFGSKQPAPHPQPLDVLSGPKIQIMPPVLDVKHSSRMLRPHPLIAKRQATSQDYDYIEKVYYTTAVTELNDLQHPQALILAIQRGDAERVQELLDAGADVHAIAPDAIRTPLEEAEMCGKQKIIELLKEAGAKPSPDA